MKSLRFRQSHHLFPHKSICTIPPNILPCQRHLFDIPDDVHWFNCAYLTPGLKAQYDGGLLGLNRKMHPWNVIPPDDFFTDIDEFRLLISKLLHHAAGPKDISINTSVSYGMAVVGKHLDNKIKYYFNEKNKKKLNIIVLKDQFPSNFYIWHELSQKYGNDKLQIKVIHRDNKLSSWTDNVLQAIDEDTILVTVPNVHWSDGSLLDIQQINDHILSAGYKPQCHFALDVTQSLGVKPFPEHMDGVDYVCGALYKWLLGPYTMGFMYVAPQHQDLEPLEYGWMARNNSRQFSDIANYTPQFEMGAHRYDMGQRAQLQLMPMALPALRQIVYEWTPQNIYDTLTYHNDKLAHNMREIGLVVADNANRGGHMLGIHFDPKHISGEEILNNMKKENFYLSIRAGAIRISPHLFCKQDEYEKIVNVMKNVILHKLN